MHFKKTFFAVVAAFFWILSHAFAQDPVVPPVRVYDRFFDEEVYYQLNDYDRNGTVDASLLLLAEGEKGLVGISKDNVLARTQVSIIALERFYRAAEEVGLKPSQVTAAMFEGRFNPYFMDVQLAYEGLKPEGSLTYEEISPGTINYLVNISEKYEPGELPRAEDLIGEYEGVRRDLWNAHFGSLGEIKSVASLVAGEERTLTKMDIGMRYVQRIKTSYFKGAYGLERDHTRTFAEAIATLEARGGEGVRVAGLLRREVERTLERKSAESYFRMGDGLNHDSKWDFREDYQNLRKTKYLPFLQGLASGKLAIGAQSEEGRGDENQHTHSVWGVGTVGGWSHVHEENGSQYGAAGREKTHSHSEGEGTSYSEYVRANQEYWAKYNKWRHMEQGAVVDVPSLIGHSVQLLQGRVLEEFQVDGLAVTGDWDTPTAVGVTAYLRALQESTGLGPNPADGLYTPAFGKQFANWLEGMDYSQEPIQVLSGVSSSLEFLVFEGIYDVDRVRRALAPPPVTIEAPTRERPQEAEPPRVKFDADQMELVGTGLLIMANGFLWEWGDEWLGKAIGRYKGEDAADRYRANVPNYCDAFIDRYPTAALILNGFGVWISIGAVLAAAFARSKGGGFFLGFICGCTAELIEAVIAYYGEMSTFGHADIGALVEFSKWTIPAAGLFAGWLTSRSGSQKPIYGTEFAWTVLLAGLVYFTFISYDALQ